MRSNNVSRKPLAPTRPRAGETPTLGAARPRSGQPRLLPAAPNSLGGEPKRYAAKSGSLSRLPRHSAAQSHHANDQYMLEFEIALSEMGLQSDDNMDSNSTLPPQMASSQALLPTSNSFGGSAVAPLGESLGSIVSRAQRWKNGPTDPAGTLVDFSDRNLLCLSIGPASAASSQATAMGHSRLAQSSAARRGGPSTCEVAVGGADHGVYTFDLHTGRKMRTLYTKQHGHSDWVSCLQHTSEGSVLSGGADGKVCLWAQGSRVFCEDLEPSHRGPVSVLICDRASPIAVSGGYDKTVRVWDVSSTRSTSTSSSRGSSSSSSSIRSGGGGGLPRVRGTVTPREWCRLEGIHGAPVMALGWGSNGVMLSGDRDGTLALTNLATSQALRQSFRHCRGGHVTCVAAGRLPSSSGEGADEMFLGSRPPSGSSSSSHSGGEASPTGGLLYSGGQDGCVRGWDPRQEQAVVNLKLHTHTSKSASGQSAPSGQASGGGGGGAGVGALVDIVPCGVMGELLVTAAADNRICVVDVRNWSRRAVFAESRQFIYSVCVAGDVVLSGGGDGLLLAHDLNSTKSTGKSPGLMWGLGACSQGGAVRAVACAHDSVVVAGDDGNALAYAF